MKNCSQCKYFIKEVRDISCNGKNIQEINYYCCFLDQLIRTRLKMLACKNFKESDK